MSELVVFNAFAMCLVTMLLTMQWFVAEN